MFELPATFEMKVWVTDGNDTIGQITIDLPKGEYPKQQSIDDAMADAKKVIENHDGMYICETPAEFGQCVILDETGQKLHVATSKEWLKPYSTKDQT